MTEPRCARDVMSTPVRFLARDASVLQAAQFLLDNRLSGAPVADETGRPVGVFSYRDLAKFFLDPAFQDGGAAAPSAARVFEFMTPRVTSVRPEASLDECRKVMRQHRIHRLLVQDAEGKMTGVVSVSDLALRVGE